MLKVTGSGAEKFNTNGKITNVLWDATEAAYYKGGTAAEVTSGGTHFGRVFVESDSNFSPNAMDATNGEVEFTGNVQFNGVGTTESSECSDRGLCDRESGICVCFPGYTGNSCHIQNAAAA